MTKRDRPIAMVMENGAFVWTHEKPPPEKRTRRGHVPWWFKPTRHASQELEPITELHCWIATFQDGHEEILLSVMDGTQWGMARGGGPDPGGRARLARSRAKVRRSVRKKHGFKSLRLASFYSKEGTML